VVTTSCSSQELRPRSLPRLAMQVGLHEGSVSDFVCLNKVHLRACPSVEVLPSKLSTLPASSKWVFIAKGVSRFQCRSLFSPLLLPKLSERSEG